MEPQSEIRRRSVKPSGGLILGTGLLLILAFVALIALFFIVSAFTPSMLGKCVAVMEINQPLVTEGASPSLLTSGIAGSEEIANNIDRLNKRDDVGAVVIVFNSGGGSVVATREIYDSVKALNKPKVAYFREVAASGAYYIATGTDYIVSNPNALTGSIGVITTIAEMQDLFEKIGINTTVIKSGKFKDIGSPYREMTPEEQQLLQAVNEEVYNEFKSIVVENRGSKLDMSKFENITDGRIMTGRQALKVGLVDQTGTKKDAIMKAAQLAGMNPTSYDDVRVCVVPSAGTDSSLFGLDSLIKTIEMKSNLPTIK
ncbi:Peptidase family S49 [Candidatus Bilamarchaeum dharawalense]|uniref:Peptidase family S49 n=1 Tax=Candidatus Bilamarchaeum dharawalense TaxID=2885759 RepID=A0A5E4LR31_9ARCH|nr:Peptidase family S49 [Candidatus Bilamarchaeum dharawalense]